MTMILTSSTPDRASSLTARAAAAVRLALSGLRGIRITESGELSPRLRYDAGLLDTNPDAVRGNGFSASGAGREMMRRAF